MVTCPLRVLAIVKVETFNRFANGDGLGEKLHSHF